MCCRNSLSSRCLKNLMHCVNLFQKERKQSQSCGTKFSRVLLAALITRFVNKLQEALRKAFANIFSLLHLVLFDYNQLVFRTRWTGLGWLSLFVEPIPTGNPTIGRVPPRDPHHPRGVPKVSARDTRDKESSQRAGRLRSVSNSRTQRGRLCVCSRLSRRSALNWKLAKSKTQRLICKLYL